jgi:hypothetical protein
MITLYKYHWEVFYEEQETTLGHRGSFGDLFRLWLRKEAGRFAGNR